MESLLVFSVPFAIFIWIHWFHELLVGRFPSGQRFTRLTLGILLPSICGFVLLRALFALSSQDVRTDPETIGLYCALGLAWLGASQRVFGFLGVSMHDDVLQRRNSSAAFVIGGQLLGITCCFAGANVGNGPGPGVVVFCAMLSTLSLALLWLLLDRVAGIVDAVTIERDMGAGIRVAGWFVAMGVVLGAAVAGDWYSASRTLLDFVKYLWPMTFFILLSVLVERKFREQRGPSWANRTSCSAAIAAVYIFFSVLYVHKRGLF
jgi:uncharacterized membrane protein YjfL (UPF0719 family)